METKNCQNCKKDFTIEPDDFGFYEKMSVPAPTFCPDCRYQRRLINRNEWSFYRRDCDLCGKNTVSIHNKEYEGPVYCQKCWWGDGWDSMLYGREYDFSKTFFVQYASLQAVVPRLAMVSDNSVNSEYTNQSQNNKNCYFLISSGDCEDCMYGLWNSDSKECMDCYMIEKCELVYEAINCKQCYQCSFMYNCYDCTHSSFCFDCTGCSDCFGCVGLRKKQYCFLNEQLTKEEYKERISSIEHSQESFQHLKKYLLDLVIAFPQKYYHGVSNVESTGDYIEHCGFSKSVFNCRYVKELSFSQDTWKSESSMDLTETSGMESDYEIQGCSRCHRSLVLRSCWDNTDCAYCDLSFTSTNLLGCIGVRSKKYCILNKQYTKEEYEALKKKIIEQMRRDGEWGEYTPASISPFAYNETVAQEYFPLSKSEVNTQGYRWYDRADRDYIVTKKSEDLPKTIKDTPDTFVTEVIECASTQSPETKEKYHGCTTAFRITAEEFVLYKKMNIPIPIKCFPCRRQDRFDLRNARTLWKQACMCQNTNHKHNGHCMNQFETTFASNRPELIYCEKCYQQEVN